jgi:hypothetical protein
MSRGRAALAPAPIVGGLFPVRTRARVAAFRGVSSRCGVHPPLHGDVRADEWVSPALTAGHEPSPKVERQRWRTGVAPQEAAALATNVLDHRGQDRRADTLVPPPLGGRHPPQPPCSTVVWSPGGCLASHRRRPNHLAVDEGREVARIRVVVSGVGQLVKGLVRTQDPLAQRQGHGDTDTLDSYIHLKPMLRVLKQRLDRLRCRKRRVGCRAAAERPARVRVVKIYMMVWGRAAYPTYRSSGRRLVGCRWPRPSRNSRRQIMRHRSRRPLLATRDDTRRGRDVSAGTGGRQRR